MSIHVTISEEAQARLAAQKRNQTISSVVISGLTILLIGLILGFVFLPPIYKENPTIITYKGNNPTEDTPTPEKVKTAIQRKPTAPASSQVKVIASTAASATSIPVLDVAIDTQSVSFGDGDDFGSGWGADSGTGAAGGAKFFEQEVKAERVAFLIDFSISMEGEREALMREELSKAVAGLSVGTKFQLIFFSGPVWKAGDTASADLKGKGEDREGPGKVVTQEGDEFDFTAKSLWEWRPKGSRQKFTWEDVTAESLKKSKGTYTINAASNWH